MPEAPTPPANAACSPCGEGLVRARLRNASTPWRALADYEVQLHTPLRLSPIATRHQPSYLSYR